MASRSSSAQPLTVLLSLGLFLGISGFTTAQQAATPAASSYVPVFVPCPASTPLVRLAGTPSQGNQRLSEKEAAYRSGRQSVVGPFWESYLTKGTGMGTGYNVSALASNNGNWPVVALAHSGGGFRASLYGASVVQAFDSRDPSSVVRGVLDLITYQSGLSGGSWVLSSLFMNGYPTIPQLVQMDNPGWELSKHLLIPGGDLGMWHDTKFIDALISHVKVKRDAGFNVSITDVWGRAVAYHFLPGTDSSNFFHASSGTSHGAGILFSQIATLPAFSSFSIPFPIVTACNMPPGGQSQASDMSVIPLNTTVWEFSPYEFGSYDPYLAAFTPMEYLGTYAKSSGAYVPSFVKRPKNSAGDCVTAFDQASFVFGTSSSLFNAVVDKGSSWSSAESDVIDYIFSHLTDERKNQSNFADYPNTFQGVNGPSGFDRTNDVGLQLVDGGENGENVPLGPLLVKARGVDVIIAADASANTKSGDANGAHWPDGSALIHTYNRATTVLPSGTVEFPKVPLQPSTWVEKGYNQRPTFFGCNETAINGTDSVPLVIYLPNSPAAQSASGYYTNTSTFQLKYSVGDVSSFLSSATASVTWGFVENDKADPMWPTCLACALVDRARERKGLERSSECGTCFEHYCYVDGAM